MNPDEVALVIYALCTPMSDFMCGETVNVNGGAMMIEMTSREVADAVAKHLHIPVIAVAAGGVADGSEMVIFDLLGFMPQDQMAKHAKAYANNLMDDISGMAKFDQEVKNKVYPQPENGWGMDPAELDKFMNELDQKYN